MEDDGILYGHLVYFTANREILWPFGTFCGHLIFPPPLFGILYKENSGNPERGIHAERSPCLQMAVSEHV
jgi:hypothetical protein